MLETMKEKEDIQITRTWDYYKHSKCVVLTVPCKLARKYGIGDHTNLLAIDTGEGIHFKELELQNV